MINNLVDKVKQILREDKFVTDHNKEEEWKVKSTLTLIAAASFALMSAVNVFQHADKMLISTAGCALLLLLDYFITQKENDVVMLQIILIIAVSSTFTCYVVIGGNDGFAALWLILVPFLAMMVADFRYGIIMCLYFLVFLFLTFTGPFKSIIIYHYNTTFLLRFPFLYLISFAFATFSGIRTCHYRYILYKKEEDLKRLGAVDLLTGVMNRNSFDKFIGQSPRSQAMNLHAVYIDLNELHELNNKDGHQSGDNMLRQVADSCVNHFDNCRIYRMGGDEFLVLSWSQNAEAVSSDMDIVQAELQRKGYSVSSGIASATNKGDGVDVQALVNEADRAMLENKKEYHRTHERRGM